MFADNLIGVICAAGLFFRFRDEWGRVPAGAFAGGLLALFSFFVYVGAL